MLKSIIVEDEPLAATLLEKYALQYPGLNNMGTFRNAVEAESFLSQNNIDLIFLDIHLPKIRGFEFIENLNKSYHIILTTAYSEYALEGFEKGVIDYLLKPILFSRFEIALNRLNELISINEDEEKVIHIQVNKTRIKLYEKNISYIESNKGYVNVYNNNHNIYRTKLATQAVLELLSDDFIRIHKSYIVNIGNVISYSSSMLELNGNISLPIGRKYKQSVINGLSVEF